MTLILGVVTPQYSFIAADTLAFSAEHSYKAQAKVFQRGDLLLGTSGSYNISNCIEYNFILPRRQAKDTDNDYIFKRVYNNIYKALKAFDLVTLEEGEPFIAGDVLLVYKGSLYTIQSNCALLKVQDSVLALGSGGQFAIGAYKALQAHNTILTTKERIKATFLVTSASCVSINNDVTNLYSKYA